MPIVIHVFIHSVARMWALNQVGLGWNPPSEPGGTWGSLRFGFFIWKMGIITTLEEVGEDGR